MSSAEIIQQARLNDYGRGVADGMEIALRLFLGEESHGGQPCPHALPPEVEAWARAALARVEASKDV